MTDRPKTGPVERAIRKACVIAFDVPKNRQGRVGEIALSFEGRYQRWQESSASLQAKKTGREIGMTGGCAWSARTCQAEPGPCAALGGSGPGLGRRAYRLAWFYNSKVQRLRGSKPREQTP